MPTIRIIGRNMARQTILLISLAVLCASSASAQVLVDGATLHTPIPGSYRQFAAEVAIDGDVAVVSDPGRVDPLCSTNCGAVHIYRRGATGWAFEETFAGGGDDRFGREIAISGSTIVVGAPRVEHRSVEVGAAYLLEYDGSAWSRTLLARGTREGQNFGHSVAIDGDLIAVGSPLWGCGSVRCGTVNLYRRDMTGWAIVGSVGPSVGPEDGLFGFSVAIDGTRVVVGARSEDRGTGAAYVFDERVTGTWTESGRLTPPTRTSDFGWDIDVAGDRVLVAAAGGGSDAGHVFVRGPSGYTLEAALGGSVGLSAAYSAALGADIAWVGRWAFVRHGGAWRPGTEVAAVLSADVNGSQIILGRRFTPRVATVARVDLRGLGESCSSPEECVNGMCTAGMCCDMGCFVDAGMAELDAGVDDAGVDAGTIDVDAGADGGFDGGFDAGGGDAGPGMADGGWEIDGGLVFLDAGVDGGPAPVTDGGCGCSAPGPGRLGAPPIFGALCVLTWLRRRRAG